MKAVHKSASANSAYSLVVSRTCDLARPEVAISNVASSGKIKLSWAKVAGAQKYEIYRATSENGTYKQLTSTTKTSLTNTSTEAGKTYYYKVKAVHKSASANSAYSSVVFQICDLAQPTVTLSNVESTGKIKVSWKAIAGALKYEVYRATSKTGTYSKISTTSGTSLTDSNTAAGKTYYYKVKAVHKTAAASSVYSTVKSAICDLARPTVTLSLTSAGKPKLTWKSISGTTKYEVYRATSKNGSYTLVYSGKSTNITDTKNVKKGTTYYYKVRAVHSKTSANSSYSTLKSIRTK